MNRILILFSLLITLSCYMQDYKNGIPIDNRMSKFIKDTDMLRTVSKVLDFTNSSSTIKLNDYSPIFITIDGYRLSYKKTDTSDEKLLDGVMNILIDHKMVFFKSELKDLKCYKINDEKIFSL